MRRAKRPSKQLLWLWLHDLMQESGRFDRGLDIACGDMEMRPFFKTKHYLGTDADANRLAAAKSRTGEDGIVCLIQDMPSDVTGDFVICLQTIGFNKDFDTRDSVLSAEKCATATLAGGMLLVNLGFRSRSHFDEIEESLRAKFAMVNSRHYGRGRKLRHESVSYFAASLMRLFPALARSDSEPCRLLVCRNRLENRA